MSRFPSGYRIGHATDRERRTGCTVVLPPPGTIAAVDVRGGAPGTRETGVFVPGNLVSEIHGLLFTGGSAFGLAAASGVTAWLRRQRVGFEPGSLKRVAIEAQDGLARAIRPAHTVVDGDIVFALSPGGSAPPLLTRLRVGAAAAEATALAIINAVTAS